MEENIPSPLISDGSVRGISFSAATFEEIRKYAINDCPVSHPSQLTNPFLGLPLEFGKCESCGTAEPGKCEGHFGYIELPVPVYHPSHVSELRQILSLVCLKCMRMKGKVKHGSGKEKVSTTSCLYCRDLPPISVKEVKTTDNALCLELRVSSRTRLRDGFWKFLDRFGFCYGDTYCRPLLPYEALNILKEIPEETKKRLAAKGYFPQIGFILQYLPVPPNCLCVPEVSDGKSIMSSDISISLLKRVLNKIELIKRSRSGFPNFKSHEVESNDLQSSISQYMHLRGTPKVPQDITKKFAIGTEANECSTKLWLEKMRTLFIRKGSGFSSRSVITGDAYIGVNVIGLPSEIAKRITFEERVTVHNMKQLQEVVDKGLCVTYKDGFSTYAIAVGSKGHTYLKVGQVINRRIMDGDIVFINRPPSTHKHSLQAFYVYVHDDHTVKINPLICAPLGADFDGDCVHIFYPQSFAAKAEVLELFSVEKQLLSSHTGNLNLQLVHDTLLALKLMSNTAFLRKTMAEQLAMFVSPILPPPAIFKAHKSGPFWTVHQILQNALPALLDCFGERHLISDSEIIKLDLRRDAVQPLFTEIITSIFIKKGPKEALNFFNMLQPLLMEVLVMEGFSISLKDFYVPSAVIKKAQRNVQENSFILDQLRSKYNELVELQVENHLKSIKLPIVNFILNLTSLGYLIDSKSDSSIIKVVQQLGFLGLQLFDRGKLYSGALVEDCFTNFVNKYSTSGADHSCEAYGLVKNCFFHGLNPYEELVHAISSREVIVRSSRGLTEPGTLFKNLMAILRDVIICYDGSVRNVCSNSIIQFEYGEDDGANSLNVSPAGEPVGVLAATAISNPAYKAVLESSQSNNSSWELMKEILLCKVMFKNVVTDRRVILYLNDCFCGKKFCKENAAIAVQNCLKRVTLKDCACDFSIEYQKEISLRDSSETTSGLVGHIHLDKMGLKLLNRSPDEILRKCQDVIFGYAKKKGKLSHFFRRIILSLSECCCTRQPDVGNLSPFPCLQFSYCDQSATPDCESLEGAIHVMANTICPILLDTIIKGDPRVYDANIVWIGPDATSWVRNSCKTLKGEVAIEVVVEKDAVRRNGDAWRTVMDACLPVMHLINTRRSIPYGIQQLQELLGISCAFDQTVQRLSASITKVAKGVLKDHLILVANSMTCTGNLIGFNTAGYKALFRSLKVQVPFTEATLITPMKCFERAAEKCHTDSLASVVSSCLWGKHVAIGTGSPFQILWNKQQMAENQNIGKGFYDFLELVRTSSQREAGDGCSLDVDDLEANENNEVCLSPEIGFEELTFDDGFDVDYNLKKDVSMENGKVGKSSWEKISDSVAGSDRWQGWENRNQPEMDVSSDWQGWDNGKQPFTDRSNRSQGWGNEKVTDGENSILPTTRPSVWSSWDATDVQERSPASSPKSQLGHVASSSKSGIWGSQNFSKVADLRSVDSTSKSSTQDGWNHVKESPAKPVWDTNVTRKSHEADNTWNTSAFSKSNVWGSQSFDKVHSEGSDGGRWNENQVPDRKNQSWKSRGWNSSNATDRRTQRNHSNKSAMTSDDRKGWNSNSMMTSTRRRLDSFTVEEERILVEIEPTMQTIRRILRESSDGDQLSADDQKFIIERVFQHHPDKQAKVADQIDHIMVDKHKDFQDSRCFYVVSCDGTNADFSYIKCMENFVKEIFPEHAESFNRKYFRRRRSEPVNDSQQQQ
ncbi:DNA-directed RNA polymerase V subunit 1 [Cocos nucifera]|uniref:DNA-directed RNA polymerase subunit n=1 Tax=Cocos nucifera TaxID=13894 RepID=A0A8K0IHR2_COCNU|nr:DNA-directed RNA polymerase V subunit 1 [Cocos nucifera]